MDIYIHNYTPHGYVTASAVAGSTTTTKPVNIIALLRQEF